MNLAGRILTLGLGLVILAAFGDAEAAPKKKRPLANRGKQTNQAATNDPASDPLTAPLITSSIMSRLRITVSQRPKVSALIREFNTKLKAEADKVQKARAEAAATPAPKAIKTKGKKGKKGMKGGRKGMKKGNDGSDLQDALALREEYEGKFMDLLTDPQKKTWEDIKIKQGEALLTGSGK